MRWHILIIGLFLSGSDAQFGEIASLATSLLGGALGGGGGLGALAGAGAAGAGAAQAGGALAQIGQLYQLAQGALQLTGTGVGVLNQASEGNWFPAVLEQTAKNSQALMKANGGAGGHGLNLGALGPAPGKSNGNSIGPEFGTSFPAPNIDDYDENAEIPGLGGKKTPTAPDGLIDIDSGDYETETKPTVPSSTTETVTLFPDTEEEEFTTEPDPTTPPPRKIRIQLPDKAGTATKTEVDTDYEDLIHQTEKKEEKKLIPTIDAESTEELKKNVIATFGTKTQPIVPELHKLVEVLQKSKLSQEEIDEIVAQVEGNKRHEKPPKFDFNSSVQNIPEKKNQLRQKITDASRVINKNYAQENKNQIVAIEKQVDELRIVPDLAQSSNGPLPITHHVTPKAPAPAPAPKPAISTTPTSIQNTRSHETRSVTYAPSSPPAAASIAPAYQSTQIPAILNQQNYNYLYPHQYQQPQQQYYYNQSPFYGQATQNYWGQQNQQNYPQVNQYTHQQQQQQQQIQQQYHATASPYNHQYQQQYNQLYPTVQQFAQTTGQPQQYTIQNQHNQQNQQQFVQNQQRTQLQAQTNVQQPQYQQTQPQTASQQPAVYSTTQQQYPNQQTQAGSYSPQQYQQVHQAKPVAPQTSPASPSNSNQVYHYYHDGRQIVQQIIPKQIAANNNLPLNGPYRPQTANSVQGAKTDPSEYLRTQQSLQQAYVSPQTRSATYDQSFHAPTSLASTASNPISVQPPADVQKRVFESTVTASGRGQAHAIRTYQASKPSTQTKELSRHPVQVSAQIETRKRIVSSSPPPNVNTTTSTPVFNRGQSISQKKQTQRRISGHVLSEPIIDHRSLLEKRTTAKPRYVRIP